MTQAFDTLDTSRQLEQAGMDRQHAEAIATAIRNGHGQLATKSDIEKLDTRLSIQQWIIGIVAATSMTTLALMLAHTLSQ